MDDNTVARMLAAQCEALDGAGASPYENYQRLARSVIARAKLDARRGDATAKWFLNDSWALEFWAQWLDQPAVSARVTPRRGPRS